MIRSEKLAICGRVLKSSAQLKSKSFHVLERTTTTVEFTKMKNARAKLAKLLFFWAKCANL